MTGAQALAITLMTNSLDIFKSFSFVTGAAVVVGVSAVTTAEARGIHASARSAKTCAMHGAEAPDLFGRCSIPQEMAHFHCCQRRQWRGTREHGGRSSPQVTGQPDRRARHGDERARK
jgi:hypothetical protein